MATYYVRTDGSNANVGTGTAAYQAWQTVTYALANMVLTTGTNYLYIAPGVYRETPTVTVTPSITQTLEIVGDPTASQFIGVNVGPVRITNYTVDNTNPSALTVFTCAKTYVTLRNLCFVMFGTASFTNSQYITIDKCLFESTQFNNTTTVKITASGTTSINATITKSIFIGSYALNICGPSGGTAFNFAVAISDCFFIGQRTILIDSSTSQFTNTGGNGLTVYNSTFLCDQGIGLFTNNATHPSSIRNCNFIGNGAVTSFGIISQGTDRQSEDYNRFSVTTPRSNCSTGLGSVTGLTGVDWSTSLINSEIAIAIFAPFASSPLIGAGTSSGAPATDIYSDAWTSSGTDVGAFARTSLAGTSFYLPTERNASVITIPPDTTSRAVYLYLGATGLTFSTTGLAAYYTRGKAAPVAITLVTQTVTGAYTSGGFVEVSSTNQPGIYRLDLPNAALVDGVDDVTVTVRGATGTNGAVLTISLLNEASTGALIVRMGPYQIKADGLGSSQPLDINVGAAQGIDTQVVDANGSGVDITASTLSVKVYNSGGTLVATYAGTATYAADGRLTFAITTAVTGTAGTYTATITRTTSASDTQVFGPLRLYVRSV